MPEVHPCWGLYWGREVPAGGIPHGHTPGTLSARNMVPLYRMRTRLGLLCQRSALLCCRVLPHTGTEGLGRSLHALYVPQGGDMTGKEGGEQEKESCRAPRGTLLHIPVSMSLGSRFWTASPQASGERHGHFKSNLFLALDVLSSGKAKCLQRGNHTWATEKLEHLPSLPSFLCSARGRCWSVEPVTSSKISHIPAVCSHLPIVTRVLCSAQTQIHGPGEGHSHLPAAQTALQPDTRVGERCYGLLGRGGGEQLPWTESLFVTREEQHLQG